MGTDISSCQIIAGLIQIMVLDTKGIDRELPCLCFCLSYGKKEMISGWKTVISL